jgi:hypothetical protein
MLFSHHKREFAVDTTGVYVFPLSLFFTQTVQVYKRFTNAAYSSEVFIIYRIRSYVLVFSCRSFFIISVSIHAPPLQTDFLKYCDPKLQFNMPICNTMSFVEVRSPSACLAFVDAKDGNTRRTR